MESGWESNDPKPKPRSSRKKDKVAEGDDFKRSMRRARSNLRRIALANEFRYFVTLTLDPEKIDRNNGKAVAKALSTWSDNMVRRKGLKYILVPELHKKGGIHFHGFFNDAVRIVPSGHADQGGHPIYNLPDWKLGFTTAIELYGDYQTAVTYVTKYIGKQGDRPMGRWYYSGGQLAQPTKHYADPDPEDLKDWGDPFEFEIPGGKISVIHTHLDEVPDSVIQSSVMD